MTTDDGTATALAEALDDEYKARATYRAVIDAFGLVRPFVNIVRSEERHIAALLAHFARLGLAPPKDRWAGNVAPPPTLEAACAAGVTAEIENAAMYDRLIAMTGDAAARMVMENLRAASQDRHLPAFRRCAERERGDGRGRSDERRRPPSSRGGGRGQ